MQALDVARNAAEAGFRLTVVSAGGGALEQDFRDSGAEFIRLQRKFPVDLYLASQIRKIIKERNIEIVHGYQPVDGIHLYLASRGLRNVRKVLSFQGFITDRKNRAAAKFLIPRMDANIAVSHGLLGWLAQNDGLDTRRNFHVVYNGADPERLRPTGKDLRSELGFSEDSLLIGMVGNFYRDQRKDQLTICRALPRVFAEIDNVHCVFAGGIEPGAEDKMADCLAVSIENGIADRVHFLGARRDVPDILTSLDVFVLSSFYEGLPVAVSEAMLAGVPMILSDIPPHREASDDGRFARIFPVEDAEILGEELISLLTDQSRREEMAARAKEHAESNFSISAHLRELRKLYESLQIKKAGRIAPPAA